MPALPDRQTADQAYESAARDLAGLLILMHRHLTEHVTIARARTRGPRWDDVGYLLRLRQLLLEALIPTRNSLDESEARAEIVDRLLPRVRPIRF
jgi:hypothetical protein